MQPVGRSLTPPGTSSESHAQHRKKLQPLSVPEGREDPLESLLRSSPSTVRRQFAPPAGFNRQQQSQHLLIVDALHSVIQQLSDRVHELEGEVQYERRKNTMLTGAGSGLWDGAMSKPKLRGRMRSSSMVPCSTIADGIVSPRQTRLEKALPFKLSSQVLVIQNNQMTPASLTKILRESSEGPAGPARGFPQPDTPKNYNIRKVDLGSSPESSLAWSESDDTDHAVPVRDSSKDSFTFAASSPSAAGSPRAGTRLRRVDEGKNEDSHIPLLTPEHNGRASFLPCSLNQRQECESAAGQTSRRLHTEEHSLLRNAYPSLPAMTPTSIDRIMTAQSLQVLRDSEQILKPVSPTSRAVINYLRTVYTRFDNTFRHTNRQRFFDLCRDVIDEARPLLQKEPLYQEVKAPCYVFGDLHGNYRDLSYFIDSIITFDDLLYTPCTLLFLGDYVDRGPYGIECVLLLLALKLSRPGQVVLLRGNHEDPLVNGDMGNYGSTSFQSQCIAAFNHKRGMTVWEMFNALIFANLPLAADIDGKIFCAHGGIPRYSGGADTRMEVLRDPNFARLASFSAFDDESTEDMPWMQYACDLCWSDPKEREDTGDMNKYGFAANRRGVGTICFGTTAVDTFLERTGFEYIFRAHQEKSDGLRLSKSARVITIFSTSDYEGHRNGAGVLFVSHTREIRLVIKKAT